VRRPGIGAERASFRSVALGVAVLLLAGGCTSSPAPASSSVPGPAEVAASSAPAWNEPASYRFTLQRHCNRGPAIGTYHVTVDGGKVVAAERVGPAASGEEEIDVPTLGGLLQIAGTAADDGSDVITRYDPADGHPIEVTINLDAEAADGASCFTVTDYRPS
jgi:hypothetical protein